MKKTVVIIESMIFITLVIVLGSVLLLRKTYRAPDPEPTLAEKVMAMDRIAVIFTPGEGPVYDTDETTTEKTYVVEEGTYPSEEDINRWLEASRNELAEMNAVYFDSISENELTIEMVEVVEEPIEEPAPDPVVEESAPVSVVERPQKEDLDLDADAALEQVVAYATNEDGSLRYELFKDMGVRHITGYDCCEACCGKPATSKWYGYTASGRYVKEGRTCALNGYAFGTVIYIEGLGFRVVEDRGGMKNGGIDVYCDTHLACYAITGDYQVYLVWSPEG